MMRSSRPGRLLLRNGCFAAVFVLAIVVGRASRIDGSDISLVWPAAAVSAIWMLGARSAVDTAVSAVTLTGCSLVTTYLSGVDLSVSVWFAFVNLIIGWGTAFLLNRRGGARLKEPADLAWMLIAVAVATGVAALLGGILRHVLLDGDLWTSAAIFWMRNGVTTFVGLSMLATFPKHLGLPRLPSRRRLVGDLAVWVFAVSVYALVFMVNVGTPLASFVLPVGVLIGLRWSTTVGVWHMFASGVFVLVATVAHRGPFVDADPVLRGTLAQGFIGCALLIVLTVALNRDSRDRLVKDLEQAHRETQVAAERLRHASLHDPLTGLANRQRLMEVLEVEVAQARELDTRVGVVFVDLDGFKGVNDVHGHAEGDLLLDAVATRLRTLLRPDDIVARLGGDEFVMVCAGLSVPGQLEAIAERVSSTLSRPYELVSGQVHSQVSASIGIAVSTRASTAEQLLNEADGAMYADKRARQVRVLSSTPGD